MSPSESEAPSTARPRAGPHTFVGGFSSALEPGSPFSVLSFPEELTRHSFLERKGGKGGEERGDTGEERRKGLWGGCVAPCIQSCALSLVFSFLFWSRAAHLITIFPRVPLSNAFSLRTFLSLLMPFSCSGCARFLTCCFKVSLTLLQKILCLGSHS